MQPIRATWMYVQLTSKTSTNGLGSRTSMKVAPTKLSPKGCAKATEGASGAKWTAVTALLRRRGSATPTEARPAPWKAVRRAPKGRDCAMPTAANRPRPSGALCRAA
ncbi:unnamed protein product [Phytophthora fragariaefolia]|uniref:Unnamed protein product n=1 Tax=Phytophthora fragariaefolia TaxID=1490495 RepID=A0A9W6YFU9_9STRA|nr:unnamed protein product [Phytophthora fragariaefolia]